MWFFKKKRQDDAATTPRPEPAVRVTDEAISHTWRDGSVQEIRWADLYEIGIVTTDEGPFVDDVFWLLLDETRKAGCVIPSEAPGLNELLQKLFALPGFDSEAVVRAMGCTDNATFLCWRRSEVQPPTPARPPPSRAASRLRSAR